MRKIGMIVPVCFCLFLANMVGAQIVPTTLDDFFLPGSQPGQSGNLEHPSKCDNCHGGYDQAVEPAFGWRGSMMAQAARDPFFYACMAIANQDAPESGDLCIRCHSPSGWLEGRSVPTDGSALNSNDREGVQCDFCHKLVAPSLVGENPYPDDPIYTADTYPWDQGYLQTLANIPPASANGMYIADSDNAKRGPYIDAAARHQMFYSPFHRDAALCGTCHDVSNPAFTKDVNGRYVPNDFGQPAPDFDPYSMFPIERTFSEWMYSAFNGPGGASCQDCHMRDVTGYGCNKKGAPLRTDLALHDLTGGNTFVPPMVATLYPGEIDPAALNAGLLRATQTLQSAATMTVTLDTTVSGYTATVHVVNETGHKLPSGYPEGRRIWVNIQAVDTNGTTVYESGAYNYDTGYLSHDADLKIYHIEPGISDFLSGITGLPAGPSFHFVINDTVYIDNRIPPLGFTNANYEMIGSEPVGYSYADGQNYDSTIYDLPGGLAHITINLFYQTTSKEYVEFLRDANVTNNWGQVLYDLWVANGRNAPVAMASETITLVQIADNEPPTAPTNLNARAISSSQIDLSWTGSIDNIGVVGYYIHRDNVLIDSTADVAYSDIGLQPRTTYSYYVTAYDAAGNISDPSNTASARTRKSGRNKLDTAECPMNLSLTASPNPFNAATRISYSLAEPAEVTLEIYNIRGQKITTLEDGWKSSGVHTVHWNADNYATGMYFVRLNTGVENRVQKIVLLK
ncbi:MAG: T9SS type A sorting domain-containing protein [Candidatus Zixiibacteriota bacterium]|nr:MAG: T9SS type A sorting domain-containing protein [candidate division Zixibacteria bacterium]